MHACKDATRLHECYNNFSEINLAIRDYGGRYKVLNSLGFYTNRINASWAALKPSVYFSEETMRPVRTAVEEVSHATCFSSYKRLCGSR